MKTVLAAATLLALGLAGTGCKRSPSLVGKWTGTAQGMTQTLDFAADEKATVSMTTQGGPINLVGDYKVTGDDVTLTFTDVQAPGLNAQQMAMVKQAMASMLNKPNTMEMTFVSPDEVSLSEKQPLGAKPPGGPISGKGTSDAAASKPTIRSMTLKRVKEGS